jgi:hypothetical protein
MDSGRPPSSRPTAEERERLEAARGGLRDALGSVRNLGQLLQSLRVGPKAIQSVLSAVHASCRPIEGWMREQLAIVAAGLGDRRAVDELLDYAAPLVRELETELALAQAGPLNAKVRLRLERMVLPLSRKLDAARALAELLESAVHGHAVRVSLPELLREAAKGPDGVTGGGETVPVMLRIPTGGEVIANPRVAVALLGAGARLVADGSNGTPHISVVPSGSDQIRLVASPIGVGGEPVTLVAPWIIDPTLTCIDAAARASGAEVRWNATKHEFSLTCPM